MTGNRREFIKLSGLIGAASILPVPGFTVKGSVPGQRGSCVLVPTETAGPFPLDLTDNPFFFRQDVREDRAGVQLNLKMRIVGLDNCEPMQNVRVHIWHCDKDGNYSGYGTETGLTYLRGWQMTDANGEVEFITILPGWYPGRVCHIHFQVYVSSMYAAISQLTFPEDTKNAIYTANPEIYVNGEDPVSIPEDFVFADGYEFQLATLSLNTETGGYVSFLEATVEGTGTTGVGYLEKEAARQFELGQNFPNPFSDSTTIPFKLNYPSETTLQLWDLNGHKIKEIEKNYASRGDYTVPLVFDELGLSPRNLVYQLEVRNVNGTFRVCRMMTCNR